MKKVTLVLSVLFLFVVSQGFFVLAADVSSDTQVNFVRPGWSCDFTERDASWIFQEDGGIPETVIPLVQGGSVVQDSNCLEYANVSQGSCCPYGWGCVKDEEMNVCTSDVKCHEFKESNTCGNASESVALVTMRANSDFDDILIGDNPYIFNGVVCYNHTSVKCFWDDSNNTCGFQISQINLGDEICPNLNNVSTCTFKLAGDPINKCELSAGVIEVNYNAIKEGAGLIPCEDKKIIYPCGSSVRLPFFTKTNFIVSFLGIFLAYFFYYRKSY